MGKKGQDDGDALASAARIRMEAIEAARQEEELRKSLEDPE